MSCNFMIWHLLITIACHISVSVCHVINSINFMIDRVSDGCNNILQSLVINKKLLKFNDPRRTLCKVQCSIIIFYGVKKCVFKNILHAIKNFMILHPLIVMACHIGDSICHIINLVNFFNGH